MELWQRFTPRARRVMVTANDEASRVFQTLIGTEHILLGILRMGEGRGYEILRELGVDMEAVLAEVRASAAVGKTQAPSKEMAFTPQAQRVLQVAYAEVREPNDQRIGTEHILLGLVREPRGV